VSTPIVIARAIVPVMLFIDCLPFGAGHHGRSGGRTGL
jgi:hypothetical protein